MTEVFMSSIRQYTDEFKSEAVKQVVERGLTVVDVATRIGIPRHAVPLGAKREKGFGPDCWDSRADDDRFCRSASAQG